MTENLNDEQRARVEALAKAAMILARPAPRNPFATGPAPASLPVDPVDLHSLAVFILDGGDPWALDEVKIAGDDEQPNEMLLTFEGVRREARADLVVEQRLRRELDEAKATVNALNNRITNLLHDRADLRERLNRAEQVRERAESERSEALAEVARLRAVAPLLDEPALDGSTTVVFDKDGDEWSRGAKGGPWCFSDNLMRTWDDLRADYAPLFESRGAFERATGGRR